MMVKSDALGEVVNPNYDGANEVNEAINQNSQSERETETRNQHRGPVNGTLLFESIYGCLVDVIDAS